MTLVTVLQLATEERPVDPHSGYSVAEHMQQVTNYILIQLLHVTVRAPVASTFRGTMCMKDAHFNFHIYTVHLDTFFFLLWHCDPMRVMASSFLRFLDHTQRRTTVGRTPLDERSARRRDLYLTTRNTHNEQTSMPAVGFEPTISAGERPQTYALDRAATGNGAS